MAATGSNWQLLADKGSYSHMSSNIKITRVCEYCGIEFTAKTTITRYCSHTCNRKHYKQKKREARITKAMSKTYKSVTNEISDIEELTKKEFLSVKETCILIGISERTLYRMMNDSKIKYAKMNSRIIFRRLDIDNLFK